MSTHSADPTEKGAVASSPGSVNNPVAARQGDEDERSSISSSEKGAAGGGGGAGAAAQPVSSAAADNGADGSNSQGQAHNHSVGLFHAAIFFAALSSKTPDQTKSTRTRALLVSVVAATVVCLQYLSVSAVFMGVDRPTCLTNDQCAEKGTFCSLGTTYGSYDLGQLGRCDFCGGPYIPVKMQLAPDASSSCPPVQDSRSTTSCPIQNNADEEFFAGFNESLVSLTCATPQAGTQKTAQGRGIRVQWSVRNVEQWCDGCRLPNNKVDTFTDKARSRNIVLSMSNGDWLTLTVGIMLVSFTIARELADIAHCRHILEHGTGGDNRIAPWWRIALLSINGFRRWGFLPNLAAVVPMMVFTKGGDALSVCQNSVAILFLVVELDNAVYVWWLPAHVRQRVNAAMGIDALSRTEQQQVVTSSHIHFAIVGFWLFLIIFALPKLPHAVSVKMLCMFAAPSAFLVAGWLDVAIIPHESVASAMKMAVGVFGAFVLGGVVCMSLSNVVNP
eukprot:COSAG01_NODE_3887_length_5585_cov_3.982501_2_plen_503_part_00